MELVTNSPFLYASQTIWSSSLAAEQVPTLEVEEYIGVPPGPTGFLDGAGLDVMVGRDSLGRLDGDNVFTTPHPILPVIPPNSNEIITVTNELLQ